LMFDSRAPPRSQLNSRQIERLVGGFAQKHQELSSA
jgi:hypothetical protein